MAKSNKKKTAKGELGESVHRIWLAGLGALATAEEEGGRLFNTLVSRGRKYERSSSGRVDRATSKVHEAVRDARGRAGATVKKIESTFDAQIEAALHRVGVPTRKELNTLSRRVDRLIRALEDSPARSRGKKKKTARKKKAAAGADGPDES